MKTLWVLSDDGQVVAVSADPKRYHELGRSKILSGKCWTTPTMSKNILLARSTKEAAALLLKKAIEDNNDSRFVLTINANRLLWSVEIFDDFFPLDAAFIDKTGDLNQSFDLHFGK